MESQPSSHVHTTEHINDQIENSAEDRFEDIRSLVENAGLTTKGSSGTYYGLHISIYINFRK